MEHTFKKRPHTVSVIVTLLFVAIVTSTFVDNASCPMIWKLVIEGYDAKLKLKALTEQMVNTSLASFHPGVGNESSITNGGGNTTLESLSSLDSSSFHPLMALVPTSVFSPLFHYLPCNLIDFLLHVYILSFFLFMCYKWIVYKKAGWHYFLIDYCYFHNFAFVVYLLFLLVKIDVSFNLTPVEKSIDDKIYGGMYSANTVNEQQRWDQLRAMMDDDKMNDLPINKSYNLTTMQWESAIRRLSCGNGAVLCVDDTQLIHQHKGNLFALIYSVARQLFTSHPEDTRVVQILRFYVIDAGIRGFFVPAVKHTEQVITAIKLRFNATTVQKTCEDSHTILTPWGTYIDRFVYPYSAFFKPLSSPQVIPISLKTYAVLQPLREAVLDLSPGKQEVVTSLFVMFLSGALGPIAWAIVGWKNALLFHSFDKMTACFLHLAPGIVQLAIMDSVVTSLQMESFSVNLLIQGVLDTQRKRIGSGSPSRSGIIRNSHVAIEFLKNRLEIFSTNRIKKLPFWLLHAHGMSKNQTGLMYDSSTTNITSTLYTAAHDATRNDFTGGFTSVLEDLVLRNMGYFNWVGSHLLFFLVWQMFYHIIYETCRVRREVFYKFKQSTKNVHRKLTLNFRLRQKRQHKKQQQQQQSVTDFAAGKDEKPCDGTVSPTFRITAYSWMLEKPPLGKNGFLYRAVMILGNYSLAKKFMYNLVQACSHVFFCTMAYIPVAIAYYIAKSLIAPSYLLGDMSTDFAEQLINNSGARDLFDSSSVSSVLDSRRTYAAAKISIRTMVAYWFLFLLVSIWNSAVILKKWINKLYEAIEVDDETKLAQEVEAERRRAEPSVLSSEDEISSPQTLIEGKVEGRK